MSKKILFTGLALLLVVMVVITSCAEPAPKPIKLIVATASSETSAYYVGLKEGLDAIQEKSGGRVEFEFFVHKTLVEAKNTYPATLKGICDISIVQPSFFPGEFPLSQVLSLYPGFPTESSAIVNWLFFKEFLMDEWKDVKVLCYNVKGTDALIMQKPVRHPDDLKGVRQFATGLAGKYMVALGATPIAISPMELYGALQKGTVDGACIGPVALRTLKLVEVCKYVTMPGFGSVYSVSIMRRESYDALPSDIKDMFDELAESVPPVIGKMSDAQHAEAFELVRQQGGEVIFLTPEEQAEFMKVAMVINAEWAEELEAKGLPGKKILEERYKFLKRYVPGVLP